jgi:hypothetical protein
MYEEPEDDRREPEDDVQAPAGSTPPPITLSGFAADRIESMLVVYLADRVSEQLRRSLDDHVKAGDRKAAALPSGLLDMDAAAAREAAGERRIGDLFREHVAARRERLRELLRRVDA